MGKLYGVLIALSLIWGTSFMFIKVLLEGMPPTAVVFGRSLFGTLMLLIIAIVRKEQLWNKNSPWIFIITVALLNNVLPWLFITSSETKITSSMASILNATTPIWTLLLGFIFFSSSLSRYQWTGISIGFIGILLLSDINLGDINIEHTGGIIFMIAAAICYGIAAQFTKRFLKELSVMQISFYTLFLSTMISFLILLFVSPNSISSIFSVESVIPFLGLGALGSGLAYIFYYYLVTKGSPEFASYVTYLVPVSAIMWGSILLNEEINLSMILGLLIILVGVYITSKKPRVSEKKENIVA